MAGPGIDSPAALDYIVPARAAAVKKSREFDYDLLVKPVEGRMMRAIWRIVRQREGAEDALQDALTIIWKKRAAVAGHPNPEALILRISVNAAYDAVRKRQRRLKHESPGLPDDRVDKATPPVANVLEDRELREAVLEAIACLPRRQATAVLLSIVEEQPYGDIARAMGCSESTVRVHVMRGRAALAGSLARERPGIVAGRGLGEKEGAG